MTKVFLGGTCNGSKWRDKIISNLKISYFNPVVDDWTPECAVEEHLQKKICDYCLYVITPKMSGVYSIAEVVDDSNKRPAKTIFCYLLKDENTSFTIGQEMSLKETSLIIEKNGAHVFKTLDQIIEFLNSKV